MTNKPDPGIPCFWLGCGKTPVPQLPVNAAKILVQYILRDVATSQGHGRPAVGRHIKYQRLPGWCRGSDRTERIYACVRILMRAGLSQPHGCRYVASLLGSTLGSSKRGRPRSHADRRASETWQTVRSLFNSFARRNPFSSEDSAEFRDATSEKWFQYGLALWAWESGNGNGLLCPPGWEPSAVMEVMPDRDTNLPDQDRGAMPFNGQLG